jgi:Flp pilus assembly protein protease CpaA
MMSLPARLVVTAWLIYVAIADIRKGEVSNWFTVPPLLAVVAWRSLTGGYPVGLALAFFLVGLQWQIMAVPSIGLMLMDMWLAVPTGLDVAVGMWMLYAILYYLGLLGGADVKVLMTLIAVYPDGRLAWLLLLLWLGVDVIRLIVVRFRRRWSPAPGDTGQSLEGHGLAAKLQLSKKATLVPHLPIIALAGTIYVWLYL